MSDRGGGLTRDIILRVKAENLSTATFTQATAAVNQLTAALDAQTQAAARGDIKEKELTETLTKLQNAAKTFAETSSQIKIFEGFEPRIKAAETALANAGTKLEEFRGKNGTSELATRKLQNELERLERTFGTMGARLATLREQQTEYGVKLAQSGIDVNNLAQSEQNLTAATNQAAASIQHLTDFKANYARITREVTAALKAQQAAEDQVAAAERARVATQQQLVTERRGSYNAELQEHIKTFNDQRAAERAAIEEQQQAHRQAQQQLITERRGSYNAEKQEQMAAYTAERAAEKARIKERQDVQIRANQINQDLALQRVQAELKTRRKASDETQNLERRSESERSLAQAAEAHRLEQERVRAAEVQRRADLGVTGRLREDYRERKRIRDEERAATRTAAKEEIETRSRGTLARGASKELGFLGLRPYELTNLGYQATDVVQGFLSGVSPGIIAAQQGPQIFQIFGMAMLKWAPVIVAGLGAIAVAVGALNRVTREENALRQFDATLKSNATAIGYSSQTLTKYTKDIRDMGVAWADAVKFIQLAVAGNVSQGRITQVGQLAQDLADINKTNFLDNAKQLIEGLDGTKAGIDKLQIALRLWTPEQYKFIQDQIAAGKAVDALKFALDSAADRQRNAAKDVLDPAAKSARALSVAWDEMLTTVGKTAVFGTVHTAMVMFIDDIGKAATEIDRIVKSQNPWASFWDSFLDPIMNPIKKVLELTKPGPGSEPATTPSATAAEQSVGVRKTNEDIAREWLRTHNYPAAQTAGVMGNLGVESGFNPAAEYKGHFGIAQWDKTRAAALKGSIDITRQLELMDKELMERDPTFKTRTGTAKEFALQFDKVLEQSGDSPAAEKARVERVRQAERYYRPEDKPTAAPVVEPVKNAVPEEQKIEIEKTLVPLREQEKIKRSISIQTERQNELDRITREVNERGGTDDQKREQIRLQMREVDAKLNREQAEQTAKDEKQKIDDAKHYNEIKVAGDKAAAEAQKNSLNGWRDVQRERDAAEAKERDRLARLDSQNDKLKEATKIVTDLGKASDSVFKTDLEKRLDAITQKYKDLRTEIEKKRDDSPLIDPAKFNALLEQLPAKETLEKGRETINATLAQAEAAAATRKDLIDSYKRLRELGVISIQEEEDKTKGAFDATTQSINDSIAALNKLLETAKDLGIPALEIEKTRAKMAELKAEAIHIDPFLKGLTKTIEDSFTNRAAEAFDSVSEAIGGAIAKTKEWKDVWSSLRSAAANFFAGILKDIATYIIKAQLAKLMSSFMPGIGDALGLGTTAATSAATAAASGTASATGAVGTSALAVIHSGGVIGVTQLPTRNVSWFDRAPRYHTGGVVGLAANEQAAILQRGEEVLTADNPRNMRNMGQAASPDINIRNVLVADPDMVPQHMASSRGEKIIMSTLTRNAATVRQLVR